MSAHVRLDIYRCADKSLARPGRKQTNVSVRMERIFFGSLPQEKKKLDESLSLDVVEIACVTDMLPSLFPSWLGLRTYQHTGIQDEAKSGISEFCIFREDLLQLTTHFRKKTSSEACQGRAISTTSRRELSSSFFFLQGKVPKEIHASDRNIKLFPSCSG